MNNEVAKLIFKAIGFVRQEYVFKYLKNLEQNQYATTDEIKILQFAKLTKLINHIYKNVPFYKERFIRLGLHPRDIKTPEDLTKIPPLTKHDININVKSILARNHSTFLHTAKTSGSTGIPLKFPRDGSTFGYALAAMYRGHRWYGADIGSKEALLWGVPVDFKGKMKIKLRDALLNRFREKSFDLNPEVLGDFFKKMLIAKPDYLAGYSSMIYQFALFLKENSLDGGKLALKMVKGTSETIYDYQRTLIEEVFDCKFANEYGAAESGIMAFECPQGSLHIMSDCVFLEILTENNTPPKENELGKIFVTDLNNYSFPIVRYEIGDMATLTPETCSCGRGLPLIKNLIGRSTDIIVTPDGKIFHSLLFYYIMKWGMDNGIQIKEFKINQKSLNDLLLQVVPAKNFEHHQLEILGSKMREYFGDTLNVRYDVVSSIPRTSAGKFRDFESALPTKKILKEKYRELQTIVK